MTPQEYIQQIESLIGAGDDRGALAFSAQHHATVVGELTDAEILHVGGLLEGASMALDLADGNAPDATPNTAEPAVPAQPVHVQ